MRENYETATYILIWFLQSQKTVGVTDGVRKNM